jgi:nucleoside phosphorylase
MDRHNKGIIHQGRGDINVTGPVGPYGTFIQHAAPLRDAPDRANHRIDVLLITAVEVESDILREELSQAGLGNGQRFFVPGGVNSYYVYGPVSGVTVAMIRSSMGAGGSGGSHQTVADAIRDLLPTSMILLGIAFGMDPRTTPLGTVLISSRVFDYEVQRIDTSGGSIEVRPRGASVEASARLLDRFRGARLRVAGIPAHEGLLLTGAKLIDNVDYKEQLRKLAPDAIGGEMEGSGVWAAAQRKNIDWIIAKAVCDYADGRKIVDKVRRQENAARNSARAVIHVLRNGGLHKGR